MLWDREPHEVKRVYKLESGGSVIFERVPPHGHWSVRMSSGPRPDALSGKYLTFQSAFQAAKAYLRTKEKNPVLLEDSVG